MRNLGLGIANKDLEQIIVAIDSPELLGINESGTKSYKLGEAISFSGIDLVFTTLEKAIHAKFTDFNTEVEHYTNNVHHEE